MNGAELFVRCLEAEGVEYVFGLPGEEISDLLKALSGSKKINFVLVRHEEAASFMADVYGRLTGRAGVCLSTLGPGATNLLTGVVDAYLDSAPLVAITGQGGLARSYQESHQYIDVVDVYKSVTKWNSSITRAEFIPQVVRKAFEAAQSERSSAVHIELPEDVAEQEVESSATPIKHLHEHLPSVVTIGAAKKAIELIKNSNMPLILAGNGAIRAKASRELSEFAKEFNIPVANTFMGKGVISSKENLSLGTIGLQTRDIINCAFEKADLIITVGYDFVEYAPKYWNSLYDNIPRGDRTIIHTGSASSETDSYYSTTVELVGDVKATLNLLVKESRRTSPKIKKDCSYGTKLRSTMNQELTMFADDDSFPVKPQRLVYELRAALSDNDILVSDVGMHKIWISRLFPAYAPNTVIISNGFASMGISLPGAIAAKLARPDQKVVAVCGDGGFLMNLCDLETAKKVGVPIVVVVFDDGQYSQIDWKQRAKFGESYFVKFKNPDFVKLAASFGCKGFRVSNTKELKEILPRALKSEDIWVIDVPVDTDENLRLSERLGSKVVCPQ